MELEFILIWYQDEIWCEVEEPMDKRFGKSPKQKVFLILDGLLWLLPQIDPDHLVFGCGVLDEALTISVYSDLCGKGFRHTGKIPIHGDASAKATLYRDRFLLLLHRLSRDQHFSKPAFDTERSQFGSSEISPIQSLIRLTGGRWVMGVISQLEDGHFYWEDLTGTGKFYFNLYGLSLKYFILLWFNIVRKPHMILKQSVTFNIVNYRRKMIIISSNSMLLF
ncbi:DNA polymerase epsilon subunit B, partial [Camellia lanceoleosa]